MLVIPAIDIRNGKCVRLYQGKREFETIYGDPVEIAKRWESEGANWLHIVDLDGAFYGRPINTTTIENIVKEVSIHTQVGGGIRNTESVEYFLGLGVDRVIIGTSALTDCEFLKKAIYKYGERVIISVDTENGTIKKEGWEKYELVSITEFLRKLKEIGVKQIVFTDIQRDGTMKGINVHSIKEVASFGIPFIVSGGISSKSDIENLSKIENINGVIVGKAIYEGKISLKELMEV